MEALGVRVAFEPAASATALAFVLGGVALGALSGLTPGLHVNNLALLLAAAAPAVPGPPRFVGAAMLAAGVVHSFLDVVPSLALGVPDPAMAAAALPGHRLVLAGRGREAVRLSALGSGLAVCFAVPLAVPVTRAMTTAYPVLRAHLPLVLGGVVAFLLLTEGTCRSALGGAAGFLGSAALGHATLDLTPVAPLDAGGMLTPLFAGLFGAPVLIEALGGAGVPRQDDPTIASHPRTVAVTAFAGALAGAVVGYLPGVSGAIAAVLALVLVPSDTDTRGFVVATSGVNTANTVFALFALATLGTPRTGVMVALQEAGAPVALPLLLASTALAGVAGFLLVVGVGDRYLRTVGALDNRRLSVGVLCLLVGVSWLFAGVVGVAVFGVAALVGLVPAQFGARRVHLMGVLLGPLIVGA
ncbi:MULTISPECIES: tripartite tricarboxylate transporter permease [Halorussus]|uniref:tripartite tricarboxylate transporter permease n=1 Tax=Halorussus TaxID=1070314 RepID=UPI00209D9571|nr:tripartite tricarboxylate transporter permease [Halorussus vallis]USZ75877.1 tripartite tricarboxylate transporter permease [Halorussus vallis]